MSKDFFGFRASVWYLTSGKNFMVIVSEILGALVFQPPDAIKHQKEQLLLSVKIIKIHDIFANLREISCHFASKHSRSQDAPVIYTYCFTNIVMN